MDKAAATRAIGYRRVSTNGQAGSGISLDEQGHVIKRETQHRGWTLVDQHQDVASGRTTRRRPGLEAALARLDNGEADVLVVAKLDRLARSSVDFGHMLKRSLDNGWQIVVLDLGVDTTTSNGRLVAKIIADIAEWESERISERHKDRYAAQRRVDPTRRFGRLPQVSPEVVRRIRRLARTNSTRKIAARLTHDGVPTPTGQSQVWSHQTVAAILRRAA